MPDETSAHPRIGQESRTGAEPDDLSLRLASLSHPDATVRRAAVDGIKSHGGGDPRCVTALLPLLHDPDPMTRSLAWHVLTSWGPSTVPLLQEIRRAGPGRLRAVALTALAQIAGEDGLPARDRAAVERLIRIQLPGDRPKPLSGCWIHWIAVPTGDQQGILDLLGLTQPRPVTFVLANDVLDADSHHGRPECFARVFVSPELDGWTFVAGRWFDPIADERADEVLLACERLSARYGRAQAYYYGAQGDGSAWVVAENGVIIRRYSETGDGDDCLLTIGSPLQYERDRRVELGLAPDWDAAQVSENEEDEWKWAAFDMAPDLARAIGFSPLTIGSDTSMRGTGVLALTEYGSAHGVPAGAYSI
ncbi:HEAT repeat domain-containing protein [Streptomyces smaragdinus]|uniref:HEAT repeat domain-containing protein n=1 Tax=Streptomyces smaragdinus TaxID=2585196 RepID=UPI002B219658|nr:HEAT repeat domain-containing protein [Streptomyces smaragdinus]